MSTFPESFFLAPNAVNTVASASLPPSISGRSCRACKTNLEVYWPYVLFIKNSRVHFLGYFLDIATRSEINYCDPLFISYYDPLVFNEISCCDPVLIADIEFKILFWICYRPSLNENPTPFISNICDQISQPNNRNMTWISCTKALTR